MKAAIGGAIAYGIWGTTRGTKDADIDVYRPRDDPRAGHGRGGSSSFAA